VTHDTTPSRLARFDALVSTNQRQVLAYARRRAPTLADAEDVAAETFIIAWRKFDAVPEEPLPWLYGVARRVLANHRRGLSRRERLAALLRVDDVPTPLRAGDSEDGPAFVALASMSPADQEVLRLVAWEELGNGDIAHVLGISSNAVAIRLHRARARFARALELVVASTGTDDLKYPTSSRTSTPVKGTDGAGWKGVAE
jgi:RNA polymerase sigma-70 factor (ECF subfamily)